MRHAMLDLRPVERAVVERVARVIGRASAAQQTLDRAATMKDPLFFEGSATWIVVERAAFEAMTDPARAGNGDNDNGEE